MEKQIEELEENLEKSNKENELNKKFIDKMTQLDKIIKIDKEDLEDFDKTQIKILINLISNIEKQIIEESLTIRVVEWIAHRDWAIRSLKILKSTLQKLLK